MKNYKLYLHIAPNGKRYYGITSTSLKKRWANGRGYKNNPHFWSAIQKYGWNNIEHILLFDNLTESQAKELEQYMIQWYDTANRKHGYNITKGGEGGNGYHHTEEWKQSRLGRNHPYAKSVICITTKRIYGSAREAERAINNNHVRHVCERHRKSAGKTPDGKPMVWKYLNHRHNKTYRVKAQVHETIFDSFDIDSWNLFDVPEDIELDYDNLPDII